MHRGLGKAILTVLDTRRLHKLGLGCLQDEDALPGIGPIDIKFTLDEKTYTARSRYWTDNVDPEFISSDLLKRHEAGEAITSPGPIRLPMHRLSTKFLGSRCNRSAH